MRYFIDPQYTMFSVLMTLFTALLFVVLTPGVFLTLPAKGSVLTAAFVHGLLFALLYHLTHKAVWHWIQGDKKVEGFGACGVPSNQMGGCAGGKACKKGSNGKYSCQ